MRKGEPSGPAIVVWSRELIVLLVCCAGNWLRRWGPSALDRNFGGVLPVEVCAPFCLRRHLFLAATQAEKTSDHREWVAAVDALGHWLVFGE
jgi:hypothetical protein